MLVITWVINVHIDFENLYRNVIVYLKTHKYNRIKLQFKVTQISNVFTLFSIF